MPEPRHLRNAPLIEALIDFRVKAGLGLRPENFADLKPRLAERFPQMKQSRGYEASFQIPGQEQPTVLPDAVVKDLGLHGYLFRSSDEKTIAQFRVDGFTLNRLRPYSRWEELFPQAMELWRLYASTCKPEVVTRLAVRYINRIGLPANVRVEGYLRAAPMIPPELPQFISSFLTRVTIYDPRTDIAANIAQALEPSPGAGQLAIILDIDAYKQREFTIDDPAIEQTFAELRVLKNLIFFNSLTEETLRGFE